MSKKTDKRQFWAGDCETDPFLFGRVPKPFIWGIYTGVTFHTFKTAEEMADFIRDQDVIVFFHNGGKFDFHFVLALINLAEDIKVINGRLVCAKIGKAEIRDSWNLLPVALKVFGSKLEIDYAKLEEPVRHLHMPEIIEYLKMDCVGLWEAVDRFEAQYGRHLTLAGAAARNWTKMSGHKMPKTDRDYYEKFSKFFYGGRVQCFQKGVIHGPIKVFDINSAYMNAMLSLHPYDSEYMTVERPDDVDPTSMVTLDCISNGALPYRTEKGAIVFPTDNERRRYYVPGHEVLAATATGSLHEVEYIQCHDFIGQKDFKIYIDHHWDGRKTAQELNDIFNDVFHKLFGNNLYGKFSANPDNYGNFLAVAFEDMEQYEDEGYYFDGMLGPHAILRRKLDPWQENFINVATGASITSAVRAVLWRGIAEADDPIYCDTDGIFCRGGNFDIGKGLGQWKDEGTADVAYIAGKKMYSLEGDFGKDKFGVSKNSKTASKGVRLTPSEIKRAATGEVVTARNDAPTFTLAGKRKVYFQERRVRLT